MLLGYPIPLLANTSKTLTMLVFWPPSLKHFDEDGGNIHIKPPYQKTEGTVYFNSLVNSL